MLVIIVIIVIVVIIVKVVIIVIVVIVVISTTLALVYIGAPSTSSLDSLYVPMKLGSLDSHMYISLGESILYTNNIFIIIIIVTITIIVTIISIILSL